MKKSGYYPAGCSVTLKRYFCETIERVSSLNFSIFSPMPAKANLYNISHCACVDLAEKNRFILTTYICKAHSNGTGQPVFPLSMPSHCSLQLRSDF